MTDEFRHRTTLGVRFRDIDAFGHVNNAVFFSYVEQARIRYLLEVLATGEPFNRLPLILARVEVDFRSPIVFGEDVTVATCVDRIGRSSISMTHRMTAGVKDRLVAEFQTVLVTYDYERSAPMPVPTLWRERIAAHERRPLEASGATRSAAAAAR